MQYQDEALKDLSYMFHTNPEEPTRGSEYLDPKMLDYSVSSLAHVNDYLDRIRNDPDVESDWNRTVLRAGAYVGEVIRLNGVSGRWHWLDYATAKAVEPDSTMLQEKGIVNCAVLWRGDQSMCSPLAKVHKFLENGREDSVQLFAQVIIHMWNEEDPQR